jgi:hypothetical protein
VTHHRVTFVLSGVLEASRPLMRGSGGYFGPPHAVPLAIAAPRVGVTIVLLCVLFFLLPQPKPRYKPGQAPSEAEKSNE